jgi:hypothetical protein
VNDGRKRQVKKSKSTTTLFEQGLKVSSKLVRKMRSAVLSVGIRQGLRSNRSRENLWWHSSTVYIGDTWERLNYVNRQILVMFIPEGQRWPVRNDPESWRSGNTPIAEPSGQTRTTQLGGRCWTGSYHRIITNITILCESSESIVCVSWLIDCLRLSLTWHVVVRRIYKLAVTTYVLNKQFNTPSGRYHIRKSKL